MKRNFYFLVVLCGLGLSAMAQTYTGTPWKSGGWNYGTNNDVNFVAENVIEAWQYDKGACMPLPTDFSTAIATFQAGDFAAGQIKAVSTYDATCAAPASRAFWNEGTLATGINRPAYFNKRKGETCDRFSTSCPTINAGNETLDANDPAMYVNPSVVTMNDSYGRLSNAGAALRYSVSFAPGKYNLLFKGNGSQVVKIRILKRAVDNSLTEVYNGTASATGTTQMNLKVTSITTAQEYTALTGYEKLLDHMKIYATGACVFGLQNNTSAGATAGTLLELDLSGNYVLEMISDGSSGAAGAFAFKYAGLYSGLKDVKQNITSISVANNKAIIHMNGIETCYAKLYNLTGATIESKIINTNDNFFNTSALSKGTYFIRIENNQTNETHKLIVN